MSNDNNNDRTLSSRWFRVQSGFQPMVATHLAETLHRYGALPTETELDISKEILNKPIPAEEQEQQEAEDTMKKSQSIPLSGRTQDEFEYVKGLTEGSDDLAEFYRQTTVCAIDGDEGEKVKSSDRAFEYCLATSLPFDSIILLNVTDESPTPNKLNPYLSKCIKANRHCYPVIRQVNDLSLETVGNTLLEASEELNAQSIVTGCSERHQGLAPAYCLSNYIAMHAPSPLLHVVAIKKSPFLEDSATVHNIVACEQTQGYCTEGLTMRIVPIKDITPVSSPPKLDALTQQKKKK